jgi:hypothetical protein
MEESVFLPLAGLLATWKRKSRRRTGTNRAAPVEGKPDSRLNQELGTLAAHNFGRADKFAPDLQNMATTRLKYIELNQKRLKNKDFEKSKRRKKS